MASQPRIPAAPRPSLGHGIEERHSAQFDDRSNKERVVDFRKGLDERFSSAQRGGPWADKFEDMIRSELLTGKDAFPYAQQAAVSCGLGICQLRLAHPDANTAQKFHHHLLSGKFINRPELLNQENGCNLHAFAGEGEAPEDTFYIECREGRR